MQSIVPETRDGCRRRVQILCFTLSHMDLIRNELADHTRQCASCYKPFEPTDFHHYIACSAALVSIYNHKPSNPNHIPTTVLSATSISDQRAVEIRTG